MEGPQTGRDRRLHRSADQRLIFGVAGGLAEYFEIDPTIARLAFVGITVLSWGTGVLVYLLLALILPREEGPVTQPREVVRENVREYRDEAERLFDRVSSWFRR